MLRGLALLCAVSAVASAGTVIGKLEMPTPPDRPPLQTKGFLDRVDNPLANVRPVAVAPDLAVVLEGEGAAPSSQGQVTWDLAGESFVHHVLAVPVGSEVVIKNSAFTPRMISAVEDAKLLPGGPLNPKGTRSFRAGEAGKIYTITDRDAPYIKGKLVVVGTMYTATVDEVTPTSAKFQIDNVTPGKYTLKVFYKDRWLDVQQPVEVTAKGKAEPTVKLPAWPAGDKARP